MKKLLTLTAIWLSVVVGMVALARATTTCTRSDMYCYESGPTANLTTIGRLDSSGNLTVAGNESVAGNQTSGGTTVFTPQVITGISSTTVIVPTATYIQLLSTQNVVTLGGLTNNAGQVFYAPISTASAVAGQMVIFYSTSTTSYVVISTGAPSGNYFNSNGTIGSATTLSTAPPKTLQFIFDAVLQAWTEVHD